MKISRLLTYKDKIFNQLIYNLIFTFEFLIQLLTDWKVKCQETFKLKMFNYFFAQMHKHFEEQINFLLLYNILQHLAEFL